MPCSGALISELLNQKTCFLFKCSDDQIVCWLVSQTILEEQSDQMSYYTLSNTADGIFFGRRQSDGMIMFAAQATRAHPVSVVKDVAEQALRTVTDLSDRSDVQLSDIQLMAAATAVIASRLRQTVSVSWG